MKKLIKKLLLTLLTTLISLAIIFLLLRLLPGDPIERVLGPDATMSEISAYRKDLGLDLPIFHQYLLYMKSIIMGDFGKSLFRRESVINLIIESFPKTILLAIIAVFNSFVLGLFLGVVTAVNHSSLIDRFIRILTLFGISIPIFSMAPALVYIFAIKLNLLPVSEWLGFRHLILPVMTLTIPLSTIILRVTRAKFIEEKKSDWVRVLHAKGLSKFSIIMRIVKIVLPTVINIVGIQLSVVMAGTIITETIFDIPGMGSLLYDSIQNRDYPLVQGIIVYINLIYLFCYLCVDFTNEILDPRLR